MIVITDLHPDRWERDIFKEILEREKEDVVILLGDYSFGGPYKTWKRLREYEIKYSVKIYGIPGNWEEIGEIFGMGIEDVIIYNGRIFLPVFGSNVTKVKDISHAVPLGVNLEFLLGKAERYYLLFHELPINPLDYTRAMLEEKAKAVIFGHIHERIVIYNERYYVNPGPGYLGNYLVIRVGKFEDVIAIRNVFEDKEEVLKVRWIE